MSYLRAQRNADVASGLASGTESLASSGFLKSYGNYLGGMFSLLWTGLAVYSGLEINKMDSSSNPNKKYYWAGPGILILLVLIANGYYLTKKSNKDEEVKSARSTYANITLVPIYLIVLGLGLMIIFNFK
jgi:hypothetical protein